MIGSQYYSMGNKLNWYCIYQYLNDGLLIVKVIWMYLKVICDALYFVTEVVNVD